MYPFVTVVFSGLCTIVLLIDAAVATEPPAKPYESPYSVKFSVPVSSLLKDIQGARGNSKDESSCPYSEWYSKSTRDRYGAWGPPAHQYPAPSEIVDKPLQWRRERVIAVALRFQGYGYQHHHVPDWDPPKGWPWKETAVGHNGKGVDCSNLTAFVYNLGFGLKPTGAIKEQSELTEFPGPGPGKTTPVERIELPKSYAELVKTLKTGDLVYIRSRKGEVSHVVLWVGDIGRAPGDTPLILDSHGEGVKDAQGTVIPCGVHLRPFAENSWYFKSASHAIRVLRDE